MLADGSLLRSEGETWEPVSPDNVEKTGDLPPGGSDKPLPRNPWSGVESDFSHPTGPRRRSRWSELKKDLVTGPI